MNKQENLAAIAKNHQDLTGTLMNNSAFCLPIAGQDPLFTVTWNHNSPGKVLLYIYNGKCEFTYGPNDSISGQKTVFLDSTGLPFGYATKIITFNAGEKFAVDLKSYTDKDFTGTKSLGASW